MSFDLPPEEVAEVTLIGTGGGYGESLVIHLGDKEWVVVDSCRDPNTRECLPLLYLKKIGVDIKNDLKLIICTHWHDDHLLGISDLLHVAENADFCFAAATDRKKFLQLVELDYAKLGREASNSSTEEFGNCLRILEQRTNQIVLAKENTILYGTRVSPSISQVIALSPSDQTVLNFNTEISSLITGFGEARKKIILRTPNEKSICLLLKLGEHRALLGADLEVSSNPREGWLNILDHHKTIDKKSSLFKIPHHGSENSFHQRVWDELLIENPVAKLTPWDKNQRLPTAEMLQLYANLTDKLYMTAPVVSLKPKRRDKSILKIINSLKCKIHEVKYAQGIIRSRNNLHTNTPWIVDLLEGALRIS